MGLFDFFKSIINLFLGLRVLTVEVVGAGLVYPSVGKHTFRVGTEVTIQSSNSFKSYSVDNVNTVYENPYLIVMAKDHIVVATFEPIPIPRYKVTVTIVGNGTVTKSPDQPDYLAGTVVTLTAVPAPGSRFVDWAVDNVPVIGNTATVTV